MNKTRWISLCFVFAFLMLTGCSSVPPKENVSKPIFEEPELNMTSSEKKSVAHDFFLRGRQQEVKGNIEVALDYYSIALDFDKNNRELYFFLSKKYSEAGKNEKALKLAHKALALPGEASLEEKKIMGELYLRTNRLDSAILFYTSVLEIKGDEKEALYILMTLYEQKEDTDGQIQMLKQLVPLVDYSERMVDKLASLYHIKKDKKNLFQVYQDAWLSTGKSLFGERIAALYEATNQIDLFLETYQKLQGEDPKNAYYQVQIARAYVALNQADTALSIYTQLIAEYPEKSSFLFGYASLLFSQGEYEKAKPFFLKLLTIKPENDVYHYYLGSVFDLLKEKESAEREFKKALYLDKSKEDYWAQLTYFYLRQGRYDKAHELTTKMSKELESSTYSWFLLGMIDSRWANKIEKESRMDGVLDSAKIVRTIELKERAIKNLKTAYDLDPEDTRVLFELGTTLERSGKIKEAVSYFKKLINVDSNNVIALNYLGYMLVEMNKELEYAGRLIDKALVIEPENGAYLDSKGWWFYRKENYKKAKEYLEKAIEVGMQDITILEHLAMILEKLGQMDQAKKQWSLILKADPFHKQANLKLN